MLMLRDSWVIAYGYSGFVKLEEFCLFSLWSFVFLETESLTVGHIL